MKISVKSMLEAVLFAAGEPLEISKLAAAVGVDEASVKIHLEEYAESLERSESALELLRLGDSYQLATRSQYAAVIKAALELRGAAALSQAAMEVLAIVAYNQPVTRAFIEQVRGVDSSSVVSSLVEKDLIEEKGRLQLPGRPLSYGTTDNFLRCFSLSDISELPGVEDSESFDEDNIEGQLDFDSALDPVPADD